MRYQAFARQGFEEHGVTDVIITRTGDEGWLQAGVFLVDLHCLGVKDAFTTEMPVHDWPPQLDKMIPSEQRVALHPACARKLVEGAVAYAQALGFLPHRDFKKARRAFGSVSARDCPETFTYGSKGKPLYVAGPNDDEDRIDRVMRTLTAKLGSDGFHYILPVESSDNEFTAADELFDFFANRPAGVTSLAALGGFLTALVVCPEESTPDELFGAVWADVPPSFAGAAEEFEIGNFICRYIKESAADLASADETNNPLLATDFDRFANSDADLGAAARHWCLGFLRHLAVFPEKWSATLARADLQSHLRLIRAVAASDSPDGEDIHFSLAELPEEIGHAVLELKRRLNPLGPGAAPASGG